MILSHFTFAFSIRLTFIDLNFSPEHLFGFSFYIPHPIVEFPKIIVDLSITWFMFSFFTPSNLDPSFFFSYSNSTFISFKALSNFALLTLSAWVGAVFPVCVSLNCWLEELSSSDPVICDEERTSMFVLGSICYVSITR